MASERECQAATWASNCGAKPNFGDRPVENVGRSEIGKPAIRLISVKLPQPRARILVVLFRWIERRNPDPHIGQSRTLQMNFSERQGIAKSDKDRGFIERQLRHQHRRRRIFQLVGLLDNLANLGVGGCEPDGAITTSRVFFAYLPYIQIKRQPIIDCQFVRLRLSLGRSIPANALRQKSAAITA